MGNFGDEIQKGLDGESPTPISSSHSLGSVLCLKKDKMWEKLHICESGKNDHVWEFCKGVEKAKWPFLRKKFKRVKTVKIHLRYIPE